MESHKLKLFYAILENAFSSGKMILMVLKVRIFSVRNQQGLT